MNKIITSINPYDRLDIQIDAMKSWNCDIYSLNSKEEIDLLSKYDFINYVETNNIINNKYIRLNEFFALSKSFDTEKIGIVNSDIFIRPTIDINKIFDNVDDSTAIVGSRYDEKDGMLNFFQYGFDTFFFTKKHIENIDCDIFSIGNAWWDYYFPLMLLRDNIKLKHIHQVAFIHKYHETRYSMDVWKEIGRKFKIHMDDVLGEKTKDVSIYEYCTSVKKFIDSKLEKITI